MVVHWPAGIASRGEVREQYHHAIDVVPTILECAGIEFPEFVNGYEQTPLPGVSMRYSFDAADAPTAKHTQYYAMLGSRGLWHDGWKVVAEHGPTSGIGHFDQDRWQLFHTDEDRAEAHDLAEQHPEKVPELVELWFSEAGKYDVLPLDDRTPLEILLEERPAAVPPGGTYTYMPGTAMVSERTAANTHSRSFRILADVEIAGDSAGVIAAQGSRFGGWSLFVKDGKLHYVYNFLGIKPEQVFVSPDSLPAGRHAVGMEFTKESVGEHKESHGTTTLYVDDGYLDLETEAVAMMARE